MWPRKAIETAPRSGCFRARIHEILGLHTEVPTNDLAVILRDINQLAACANPNTVPLEGCGWCERGFFHALPLCVRHDPYPIVVGHTYGEWEHTYGHSYQPVAGDIVEWRTQSWAWVTARHLEPPLLWWGVGYGHQLEWTRLPLLDPQQHDHRVKISTGIMRRDAYRLKDFMFEVDTTSFYSGSIWPDWPCPRHY